jgi:hypothetical protein
MGFAITWFAVPEQHAAEVLRQLHLMPTGEREDLPESTIAYARLTTGWAILWYGRYDCPFLGDRELAGLSSRCDIIRCLVEEHVMASSAELWASGRQRWRISHQGEDGPRGLEVTGIPPDSLKTICDLMEEAQRAEGGDDAEVDYIFEIPLKVAQGIAGFKHDEVCGSIAGGAFEVLERASPPGGFLSRLFGRKKWLTVKFRSGTARNETGS